MFIFDNKIISRDNDMTTPVLVRHSLAKGKDL